MLCEECHVREATIAVVVRAGEESTTRHLCAGCMKKVHQELIGRPIKDLLSGILSAISDGGGQSELQENTVCPRCGMTLHEFQRTGHLGCAGCYDAFRTQLQPMLLRIHGRVQHAGRRPGWLTEEAAPVAPAAPEMETQAAAAAPAAQPARKCPSRRDELTRLMAQAVAVEDFETAAQLRDELRALQAREGQA